MPLLEVLSVVAAKTEATPGTAETLAQANANILARNIQFKPGISSAKRNQRTGTYSRLPNVNGSQMGELSFEVDIYGTNATGDAPGFDVLLKACRFSSTDGGSTRVYAPSTAAPATLGWYKNGVRHQIYGAVGTVVFEWVSGQPGVMKFRFMGCLSAFSDQTILANTYPTNSDAPPPFVGAGLSLGGLSSSEAVVKSATIDWGNSIAMRSDGNNATGYKTGVVGESEPTLKLLVELVTAAEFNATSIMTANTTSALAFAYGSGTNKITVAAPTASIIDIAYPVENGVAMLEITCLLASVDAAGNNELTITLGT